MHLKKILILNPYLLQLCVKCKKKLLYLYNNTMKELLNNLSEYITNAIKFLMNYTTYSLTYIYDTKFLLPQESPDE